MLKKVDAYLKAAVWPYQQPAVTTTAHIEHVAEKPEAYPLEEITSRIMIAFFKGVLVSIFCAGAALFVFAL